MPEGTVAANGISLWYETFGNPTDSALVLISGLAIQGIEWPRHCANASPQVVTM